MVVAIDEFFIDANAASVDVIVGLIGQRPVRRVEDVFLHAIGRDRIADVPVVFVRPAPPSHAPLERPVPTAQLAWHDIDGTLHDPASSARCSTSPPTAPGAAAGRSP